jgi:hypothetical protein
VGAPVSALPPYRVGTEDQLALLAHDDEPVASRPTHVTLRRGVTTVQELAEPMAPGSATLVVAGNGRSATIALTSEDLAEGVLVGRSERCIDRGIAAALSDRISRAHLLLLESGGRVEAFDLCSTNGTQRGRERVRRVLLDDDGVSLRLGTRVTLTYSRRA